MNQFAKKLSITLLTAVTAIAPLTTSMAQAGDRSSWHQGQRHRDNGWRDVSPRRHHGGDRVQRHGDNNDALVLGIIGLGAAAIIGGAIANSQNNPRVIYRQPVAPQAASGGGYEPWSRSWYRFCSNKYRSFNASTGTYRGYDGRDHFCEVN